jgi:hypothetical protein
MKHKEGDQEDDIIQNDYDNANSNMERDPMTSGSKFTNKILNIFLLIWLVFVTLLVD